MSYNTVTSADAVSQVTIDLSSKGEKDLVEHTIQIEFVGTPTAGTIQISGKVGPDSTAVNLAASPEFAFNGVLIATVKGSFEELIFTPAGIVGATAFKVYVKSVR